MVARAAEVEANDDGFHGLVIDDRAPYGLPALMTGAGD